jgi:hypothetical protein
MRGAIVTVFVLVGLDVLLSAPASRLSTVLGRPSHWLAAWMDPRVPLIPRGHLDEAAAAGSGPAQSTPIKGSAGVRPKIPGKCPPGYLWDAKTGVCLRELG